MRTKNFKQLKAMFFVASLSLSLTALGQTGTTSKGSNAGTGGDYNSFFGQYAGKSTSYDKNTFIGRSAGENSSKYSVVGNTYIGYKTGQNNDGSVNVFIGFKAGGQITNTTSNRLYISNSDTNTPLIYGTFKKGTTVSPQVTVNGSFTVTGDAIKEGGGSWGVASDSRLKKDIRDFTDGLETLQKIKPVRFRYNGKAGMPTNKEHIGVIAQQMQEAAPYTIGRFTHTAKDGSQTEYLKYDDNALTYILVNAVKAQEEMIQTRQQRIDALQDRLTAKVDGEARLQSRIKSLEKLVAAIHDTASPAAGEFHNGFTKNADK